MTQEKHKTIQQLRQEIDQIDDAIHELAIKRADFAKQIGKLKPEGFIPISPIREHLMLERLKSNHKGPLSFRAIAMIWREIIAANTLIQSHYKVCVFGDDRLKQLAKIQFSNCVDYDVLPVDKANDELMKGNIAVFPLQDDSLLAIEELLLDAQSGCRIFVSIPSIVYFQNEMAACAIGKVPLPKSHDSLSYLYGASDPQQLKEKVNVQKYWKSGNNWLCVCHGKGIQEDVPDGWRCIGSSPMPLEV